MKFSDITSSFKENLQEYSTRLSNLRTERFKMICEMRTAVREGKLQLASKLSTRIDNMTVLIESTIGESPLTLAKVELAELEATMEMLPTTPSSQEVSDMIQDTIQKIKEVKDKIQKLSEEIQDPAVLYQDEADRALTYIQQIQRMISSHQQRAAEEHSNYGFHTEMVHIADKLLELREFLEKT
jgi:hypothetical protein